MRYLALGELIEAGIAMSPRGLVTRLESRGFAIRGKGNNTVSDALRWEVAKGRVIKPARGRYRIGSMPKPTQGWILGRARRHRASLHDALDAR